MIGVLEQKLLVADQENSGGEDGESGGYEQT
jgi:hypothetical protein